MLLTFINICGILATIPLNEGCFSMETKVVNLYAFMLADFKTIKEGEVLEIVGMRMSDFSGKTLDGRTENIPLDCATPLDEMVVLLEDVDGFKKGDIAYSTWLDKEGKFLVVNTTGHSAYLDECVFSEF
jgi:hypothetical protein